MASKSAKTNKSAMSTNQPGIVRQSSFGIMGQSVLPKKETPRQKVSKPKPKAVKVTTPNQVSKGENDQDKSKEEKMLEQEAVFDRVLEGSLDKLPSLPHSTVRVFLSSTFSDMRAERNAIVRDVNPLLKEYCAKFDLDFQFVDMRWGVTEDSQNDHSVEKICLLEVKNCQNISLGPNFILISGDRYGFRPIPTEINMEEYETIKKFAVEENIPNAKLLDTWYLLDENSIPPHYILQPIRSQFTFYGDYSAGCDEPRNKDTKAWDTTFSNLQKVLREAASLACNAKQLSKERLHHYFLSVTELEAEEGIIKAKCPKDHVSVYRRVLMGLNDGNITDQAAKRYFDTTMSTNGKLVIDQEAKSLREIVVTKTIPHILKNSKMIHKYEISWQDGGVDPSKYEEHAGYVSQLCYELIQDMSDLIDKAKGDQKTLIRTEEYYSDYHEILHHHHFCNLKCETFCGRADVLQKAKDYILNDKSRKPLIMHAPSGAGKTSVMAKVMQSLPHWLNKQPFYGIIRFLGTSRYSLDIYEVIFGVCGQLADRSKALLEPVGYKNMKSMLEYFPRYLRRVASKVKKPIIILLDSLDQLLAKNDAYLMKWLPTVLPSNVRIIVSTLPEEHEILDTLKKMFPDESNFVEVPSLPDDTGFEIIDKYLAKQKRTVTQIQTKHLISAFRKSRGPLYLKLILDEAVSWNSYTPDHALVLQDTVQGAINQLFDNMEKKFGSILISHALGYITVGLNGISDIEWEDVLSCDDEVLDDLYRYHNPPVPGIVRMPPVIVARIRYDLREYIVERRSFGKTTLNWYHRQFIETAHTRYATGNEGKKLHKVLAEYFMANDGIKRDITLQRRRLTIENADRQVTKQPLVMKNQRKLTAAPYHLTHAGDLINPSTAKSELFCSLNYLMVRIPSLPLSTLIEDMTEYLDKIDDDEIAFLRNFFLTVKMDSFNGTNLAISMLSQLHVDDDQKHLKELIKQAREYVFASKSPLLIPVFPCMAPRKDASSALVHIYNEIEDILDHGTEAVLFSNEKEEESEEAKLSAYDANNGEIYVVEHNENFKSILPPVLDRSEKRVIQFSKDSFQIFHLHNQVTNTKVFSKISSGIAKSTPVVCRLSTDSLHLSILFNNSDILTMDTKSFKEVNLITLKEDPEDVTDIVTTNIDNLNVIVATKTNGGVKNNDMKGLVIINSVGSTDNGKTVQVSHAFKQGFVRVGFNETLLVGCSNTEEDGILTVINVENKTVTISENLSSKIKQFSVSHSHELVAIWLEQESVLVYNISEKEVVQQLNINNTITSFGVCWIHDLVFIGDNQGQLIMYKGQTGKHFGDFKADNNDILQIAVLEDQVVTLSKKNSARVWQLSELLNSEDEKVSGIQGNANGGDLLFQKQILAFDTDLTGKTIFTASEDKNLRLWSVDDVKLQKTIHIGVHGNKIVATSHSHLAVLDDSNKVLKILDYTTGFDQLSSKHVVDFCIAKNNKLLFLVKSNEKTLYVETIDLELMKSKSSFLLKQSPQNYEKIDLVLSESERYLVLRVKIGQKEYEEIQTSWKKRGGGFLPQSHWHRFYAVDLTQATGGLMPCNRILTKNPHLGEMFCPYKGNVMMISTRRWVIFWDIPTGKADQKVTKGEKYGFCYRPDHAPKSGDGTSLSLKRSPDGNYIVVGSEDGFLIVWEADTGFPVGRKEPKKRHTASVVHSAISPNSKWVVSSCLNNVLKLWDITTGLDVASLKITSDVQTMKFTADSKYLVVNTGDHNTRMLVFKLHPGM